LLLLLPALLLSAAAAGCFFGSAVAFSVSIMMCSGWRFFAQRSAFFCASPWRVQLSWC